MLASVSIATVSRALNTPERVAPATQERVRAAMRQLGYSYNAVASSLSRQRTMTLGLIVPTLTNPIFAESTRGVQQTAAPRGWLKSRTALRRASPARALLSLPHPPTAIFCSNDILAFGAIRAALDLGLRVPRDSQSCGRQGTSAQV